MVMFERYSIASVVVAFQAVFTAIHSDIYTMLVLLLLDFIAGLACDLVQGGSFSRKKFVKSFKALFLISGTWFFIYAIGWLKGEGTQSAQAVGYLVWVCIYFYASNICRNLRDCFSTGSPAYRLFDFIYFLVSFEFANKLKLIEKYNEYKIRGNK